MKKYKRIVDNNSRWQGDTDTKKRIIRINKHKSKKKSSIIDTIVHEEMHAKHPAMSERTIRKKVPLMLKRLSRKAKNRLYARYKNR